MDPEAQKRFEEFDERMRQAETRILASGNLVHKAGIPWLVDTQVKVDALMESHIRLDGALHRLAADTQVKVDTLMDSQTRLYGVVQQLAERTVDTQVKVDALMDSHTRLYGALQQLTESQKKTDENLSGLAATVQAFIDSM